MLKTENLTVKYEKKDRTPALDGVSFTLNDGERVALIGANGAGKSTLLLSLVGVLTPSSGTITLRHDKTKNAEHSHSDAIPAGIHAHEALTIDATRHDRALVRRLRSHVGMLFQNPDDQIFMPLVRDDIAFGPSNYGVSREDTDVLTEQILARLGIPGLKDRLSHKLSDGEKRLIGLAGILVMDPFILLLDEPFTFLDRRAQRTLAGILKELGHTLILATHDFDMARTLTERTILLKKGKIVADGETTEILTDEELLIDCGL